MTARAPYNFVPLPEKILPAEPLPNHDVYDSERKSGYFTITLTTKTPLYLRGMLHQTQSNRLGFLENKKDEEKTDAETLEEWQLKSMPNPFSINGDTAIESTIVPTIPGSSLRGMIRTLVEIITASKLKTEKKRRLIFRAVFGNDLLAKYYRGMFTSGDSIKNSLQYPDSKKVKAGYLQEENGKYYIYPAKPDGNGETFALVNSRSAGVVAPHTVHPVNITLPTARSIHPKDVNGTTHKLSIFNATVTMSSTTPNAYMVIPGEGGSRRWYPAVFLRDNDAAPIKIPDDKWEMYKEDVKISQRTLGTRVLYDESIHPRDPNGKPIVPVFYILENGQFEYFGPTMFFRIPYKSDVDGCVPPYQHARRDVAEAMFGYLDEDKKPVAGRISVSDGILGNAPTTGAVEDVVVCLPVLNTPKPTTVAHYVEPNTGKLQHYDDDGARLRGYKRYWVRNVVSAQNISGVTRLTMPMDEQIPPNNEQGKPNYLRTRVRAIRPNTEFVFRVHFENLTVLELSALTWALTLGGQGDLYHQLGMGKPFGMGAVKLGVELTLINRKLRYQNLFGKDGGWKLNETTQSQEKITQLNAYYEQHPAVKSNDFQSRRKVLQHLCTIRQDDSKLFSYMRVGKGNDNEYRNRPILPNPLEIK